MYFSILVEKPKCEARVYLVQGEFVSLGGDFCQSAPWTSHLLQSVPPRSASAVKPALLNVLGLKNVKLEFTLSWKSSAWLEVFAVSLFQASL